MDIYKEIERSVIKSLKDSFTILNANCEVIASHQNGPEPTKSYVTVTALNMIRQGFADKSGMAYFPSAQAREYSSQSYESLVQLNFYGNLSSEHSMLVHSQFRSNSAVREIYLRNNLAPRRISDLRRSPQLRDNVWVNSFSLDISLGFTVLTVQDVDWADYVTVNGIEIPLIDD